MNPKAYKYTQKVYSQYLEKPAETWVFPKMLKARTVSTNDAKKNLKYELITIVFEDDHMEEIKAIFEP